MFSRCFLCSSLVNLLVLASLKERSICGVLGCFLGVENGNDLKKVLTDKTVRDVFALFWGCYDSKLKGLSNELTFVLSNTRELDRVPNTK